MPGCPGEDEQRDLEAIVRKQLSQATEELVREALAEATGGGQDSELTSLAEVLLNDFLLVTDALMEALVSGSIENWLTTLGIETAGTESQKQQFQALTDELQGVLATQGAEGNEDSIAHVCRLTVAAPELRELCAARTTELLQDQASHRLLSSSRSLGDAQPETELETGVGVSDDTPETPNFAQVEDTVTAEELPEAQLDEEVEGAIPAAEEPFGEEEPLAELADEAAERGAERTEGSFGAAEAAEAEPGCRKICRRAARDLGRVPDFGPSVLGLRSGGTQIDLQRTETSNARPARLVCDFGDSVSSCSSDEVDQVGAEKQPDKLGETGGVGSLTPSDEATATPPPLGGHSSCSETLASEDHSAQQIPWPQKLIGKATERAPEAAMVSAVPHVPQPRWRSTSQPCRDLRRPGALGPGRHEPKRATARPADPRSELWEPLRKVMSIKDAATQTSRRKPRAATSQTQSQSQRQAVGAAKPVRKPDIGSGLSRSARCKTPRSSRGRASSVAKQGPKPRPSTRVMKNRSYSAPTVSTSQRSVVAAQNPKRRSHSAGPCHHRRCVACLMAQIRSMSWPPGFCARKPRLQKASKSRSCSQSKTQKPKLYSPAEIRAQKVLEQSQSPQESPGNFQEAKPQPQSQVSRLDGAVQTDSSLFQALHAAENSEFAGNVQQMPEVECVACDEGLDRRLPCIPPSWMCIQEVTCMRKFVGGILRHPTAPTAESNSNPRAAELAALAQVPRPVVEVKVRKKEPRKSRKSLAGQRLRA
ncbi:unnamed protein product [Symbiodinium sp. CCMP2592]|nr:unnamed protein product [Symbiodinium sp. CCMP2592]